LLALVVPAGVEGQCAEQLAGLFFQDPDVKFVDQHQHPGAGVAAAEAEVVQAAVVPQGEFAVAVDAVFADAEVFVDEDALASGHGAGPCVPRFGGCAAADAAVWPLGVVVLGEGVELGLQDGDAAGAGLAGQPFLERLVEALHLAAGLRVIGLAMAQRDAESDQFAFQGDPAVAAVAPPSPPRNLGPAPDLRTLVRSS